MPDTRLASQTLAAGIDLGQYRIFTPPDPFEDHVGPIFHRIAGDPGAAGSVHCVLPTEAKMGNAGGVLHGGVLLTFADYALCLVAGRAADKGTNSSFALTVSLSAEFLAAGTLAAPLEASGEPLRVTGSLAFARGTVTQAGRTLMNWSGTCRHIARAKAMARKAASQTAAPAQQPRPIWTPPAGLQPILRPSAFTDHTGEMWFRRGEAATEVEVLQPTLPQHANSGGVLHGGMMMSFADNAFCTALTALTGKLPYTVSFAAEFLAAGEVGPPLEGRVEVSHASRRLGFTRGTVQQGERVLLNFNAVAALRDEAAS